MAQRAVGAAPAPTRPGRPVPETRDPRTPRPAKPAPRDPRSPHPGDPRSPAPQNGSQALIWEKLSTPPHPPPGVGGRGWGDGGISWRPDLGADSLSSYTLFPTLVLLLPS